MKLVKNSFLIKQAVQFMLIGALCFNMAEQTVQASENSVGNDFIKDVEMKEFDGSPLTELTLGMMARLYYTLEVPQTTTISTGDTLDIELPEQIQAIHKERIPVYSQERQVGEIVEIGTESEIFTINFIEDVPAGSELVTEDIVFNVHKDMPIKINFWK